MLTISLSYLGSLIVFMIRVLNETLKNGHIIFNPELFINHNTDKNYYISNCVTC